MSENNPEIVLADRAWLGSVPDKIALLNGVIGRIDALNAAFPKITDRRIEDSTGISRSYLNRLRRIARGEANYGFNYETIEILREWLLDPPAALLEPNQNISEAAGAQ